MQKDWLKLAIGLFILVVLGGLIAWQWPLIQMLFQNPEGIRSYVAGFGMWAPLVYCILYVFLVVIAVLPATALNFLSGAMFGFWAGIIMSWVCTVAGALIAISLMRSVARSIMNLFISDEKMHRFDIYVRKKGWAYLFLLYIIPNPLGDTLNYLGAASNIRMWKLLIMVGIGRIPALILRTALGTRVMNFTVWTWLLLIAGWLILMGVIFLLRKQINRVAERLSVRLFPSREHFDKHPSLPLED